MALTEPLLCSNTEEPQYPQYNTQTPPHLLPPPDPAMDQPPKHLSPLALNPSLLPVPPVDTARPKTARSPGVPPAAKMAMYREQLHPLPAPRRNSLITNSKIKRIDIWRSEIYGSDLSCVCSLSTSPESYSPAGSIFSTSNGTTLHPSNANALATQTPVAVTTQESCCSPASSVYSASDILPASTQATSSLSSSSMGFSIDRKQDLCPQCGAKRAETRPPSGDCDSASKPCNIDANPSASTRHGRKNNFWNSFRMLARKCAGKAPATEDPKEWPASGHSERPNNRLSMRVQTTPSLSPLSPELNADPSPRPFSPVSQNARKRFSIAFLPTPPNIGKAMGHRRSKSTPKPLTQVQAYLQEAAYKSAEHKARATCMYAELRALDNNDERLKLLLGDKMIVGAPGGHPNKKKDNKKPDDEEEWDVDELIAESEDERRRRMIEMEKLGDKMKKRSKGLRLGRPASFGGLGAKF